MSFYRLLTRLAAQIILGLATFVWAVIALLDEERAALRPFFAVGCLLTLLALVGLGKHWRLSSVAGAVGLFMPIGMLAQSNGASVWLWGFWLVCIVATERWMRDADGAPPEAPSAPPP